MGGSFAVYVSCFVPREEEAVASTTGDKSNIDLGVAACNHITTAQGVSSDGQNKQFDGGIVDEYGWTMAIRDGVSYEYKMDGNHTNKDGGFGIQFRLYAKVPSGYKNVDFIQNIKSNSPIDVKNGNADKQRWDGDPDKSNYPFYWSKDESAYTKITHAQPNGYSNYFDDSPGRYNGSQSYYWQAELSLAGTRNGQPQNIITFTWGYFYFNQMAIPIGPFVTSPTPFQQSLINSKK